LNQNAGTADEARTLSFYISKIDRADFILLQVIDMECFEGSRGARRKSLQNMSET